MITDEQQKMYTEIANKLTDILDKNDLSYFECITLIEMVRAVVLETHNKQIERLKRNERMLEN